MFRLLFVHYTCCSVCIADCKTFLEIAAYSVGNLFSLSFVCMDFFLFISQFAERMCFLMTPVHVH